ncbi:MULTISPECIES: tripartite tricarboxylate transporter substrate binding protein [unclassified Polynucleobacter]|uniref:Bug family tripartite tricarboxylate transporter substrate binding protein n=1 Tax=unclassified Polynucleobacter TaxID=2640945 RepID=UPI0024905CC8|nr:MULTISPECIES: tripartite tricarboxylate transporter substrate binding protein [unclassified Polynucleobacter]
MIIPFAPGGVTDIGGRYIAQQLSQKLGVEVYAENKSGASGNIGASYVAKAEPDGYTLLVGFDGTLVINPHIFEKIPFNTMNDFSPVGKIGDAALILLANPNLPAKTVKDVVVLSLKEPKGLSYATSGIGVTPHIAGELLKQKTKANLVAIPYKSGGQALIGLIGGDVPLAFTNLAGATQYVDSGQLKPIAVSAKSRVSSLPNVPTFIESGFKDISVMSWIGLLAPAKTPRPVIAQLNKALNEILNSEQTKEKLSGLGILVTPTSPETFSDEMKSDLELYEKIVKSAGIKAP